MHILHSGCAKVGTLAAMAALVSSSVMAALPQPVFPAKDGASAVSLDAISASEFSIAFWAKYDRIPSVGSPTGLYDFSIAKDGTVTVTLFAKPTEFQGDLVFTSKDKVKKGEWNHFELTYTLEQKRVAFYMNGRLQWENDNLFLPKLRFNGETGPKADFRGEVRDFRLFDAPLANEYLAIAQNVAASIDEIMVIADGALKDCKNGALSAWVQSLKKEAENLKANPDVVTMGQVKDLKRDVLNASLIADEAKGLADQRKVFGAGFTLFDVPPLSQTPVLNYSVPKNGKLATEMRIALSPGEYENGSVVAFSFKPLTLTEVRFDNFTGPDKAVIPASSIDIKLVKRWYRSGGAWLSYHNDHRQRNITPDLLVNDDNLIKVDEHKRANFLRLDYPNGTIYANSSEAERGHISWQNKYPFQDAATLQPFTFKEAGCNQQYLFTFHAPKGTKPGLYKSELIVKSTDGMCRVPVTMSVLPIDLPELPSSYDNLDRSYISHMNHLATGEIGATLEKRKAYYEKQLKNLRAHNMNHTTHIWNSPELIKMSLDAGFIPDRIFGTVLFDRSNPKAWYEFFPGIRRSELTSKDKENGLRAVMRNAEKWQEYFKKYFPKEAKQYFIYYSEVSAYASLVNDQQEQSLFAHMMGHKIFAHTMNKNIPEAAGDIMDMTSSTSRSKRESEYWHAAGGEMINYANPFPGSENPEFYRRLIGLTMYKEGHDGHMLHGFRQGRTPFNEFALDKGGDGDYRNFCMAYPMHDGIIYTLAWEGVREAYDDVRYFTRLRQLTKANINAENLELQREAKRAAIWLEKLDGRDTDLEMAKFSVISRILTLQDSIKRNGGVMPDPDMAIKNVIKK